MEVEGGPLSSQGPRAESYLGCFLAVWSHASESTSLNFHSLIRRMDYPGSQGGQLAKDRGTTTSCRMLLFLPSVRDGMCLPLLTTSPLVWLLPPSQIPPFLPPKCKPSF